jgi:outer membrane protein TolC
MKIRQAFAAVCILLPLLLSGCASVGPDYQEPEVDVESAWLDIEEPKISGDVPEDPQWWSSSFRDPDLDHLIETALAQNLTVRSAGLRVLQSQQQLAIAIGNQFPQQQQPGMGDRLLGPLPPPGRIRLCRTRRQRGRL